MFLGSGQRVIIINIESRYRPEEGLRYDHAHHIEKLLVELLTRCIMYQVFNVFHWRSTE